MRKQSKSYDLAELQKLCPDPQHEFMFCVEAFKGFGEDQVGSICLPDSTGAKWTVVQVIKVGPGMPSPMTGERTAPLVEAGQYGVVRSEMSMGPPGSGAPKARKYESFVLGGVNVMMMDSAAMAAVFTEEQVERLHAQASNDGPNMEITV